MSFGLNNFLKKTLPKSLSKLTGIGGAPTIILQIIITIVFFDSVWIKANKGLTRSLVAEVKILSDVYDSQNSSVINFLTEKYRNNFDFVINFKEGKLPQISSERKYSPMDRSLRRELKSIFGNSNYWFSTTKYEKIVEIKIKKDNGIIQVLLPKEKIATSSFRLFILWITLPSILLISIVIIFLKNQTRPIT